VRLPSEELGFDKYDLEANQRGKVTEHQRQKIIKRFFWPVLWYGLFLVFATTPFTILTYDPSDLSISTLIKHIGGSFVLLGAFSGLYLYQLIMLILDLRSGKSAVVEGKAYTTLFQPRGYGVSFLINGIRFRVSQTAKSYYTYRVYYMPNTKILLSMQKIST
jgi:hypothetical protein